MKTFKPLEKDRLAFFKAKYAEYKKTQPTFAKLRKHLLKLGGLAVVPQPDVNSTNKVLLKHGNVTTPRKVKRVKGEVNGCHFNASRIWLEDDNATIQTGYALCKDGLWRQHSWILKDSAIVETTAIGAIAYFGRTLPDKEAVRFAIANAAQELMRQRKLNPTPKRRAIIAAAA